MSGDVLVPEPSGDASATPHAERKGPTREVLEAIGARRIPAPPTAPRVPRLPLLLGAAGVVAAWTLLSLWGLGAAPFHTKGEPREALVVWEMTHGSSWVLPLRNGTELPSKPPLFHWLGALTATAQGELDEWSVRLPSALTSLLGSLLVLWAGAALFSVRAGLVAALALLTTFEWSRAATTGRVDMTLTLGLELAFVALLFFLRDRNPRWLVPLYLGIALSVLGKGPVGIALPGALALLVCVLSRDITPLQQMRLLRGAVAVGVLGGSWYFLAYREGGYDFFYKQVLDENVFRFLGSDDLSGGHRHPAWRLYALLLLGLLPWTLLLPAIAARLWRDRGELEAQRGIGYLLLWMFVVLAFYSIPASKRSVYLLALYPAAALLVGWWIDAAARDATNSRSFRVVLKVAAPLAAVAMTLLAGIAALLTAGLPVTEWLGGILAARDAAAIDAVAAALQGDPTLTAAAVATLWLGALGLVWAARAPRPLAAFACLWLIAAGANVLTRQLVLPPIAETKTARELMHAARQAVEPGYAIFFHRTFDYGAVYYWDGHIPRYEGSWPHGAPRYLLVDDGWWRRRRAAAVHDYRIARGAAGEPLESSSLVLIERRASDAAARVPAGR